MYVLDGMNAAGDWTLTVSDNVGFDTGTLDAWGLNIDSGTLLWSRQLGTSTDDWGKGVSADGLGSVYISGYTFGSLGGANAGVQFTEKRLPEVAELVQQKLLQSLHETSLDLPYRLAARPESVSQSLKRERLLAEDPLVEDGALAILEVLAKAALGHRGFQVGVGGREDADIG